MFHKPGVELIKALHQTGRQLAVLKRMYHSYALIIRRILEKQKPFKVLTASQLRDNPTFMGLGDFDSTTNPDNMRESMTMGSQTLPTSETFGAPLSQAAIVRFERLLDRINLYALSEIQECLDEKDALVFMVSILTLRLSAIVNDWCRTSILLR